MKDTAAKLKEASETDHQRGVNVSVSFYSYVWYLNFDWFVLYFFFSGVFSKRRRLLMLSLQKTFSLY